MPEPIDLAKSLLQAFNTFDCNLLASILHDKAEHGAPGLNFEARARSRDDIVSYFKHRVFPRFSRITFSPIAFYIDAPQGVVVVEWESSVCPAKGSAYANSGVFIIKVADARIQSLMEYYDTDKVRRNVL